jgi:hypothetical protein
MTRFISDCTRQELDEKLADIGYKLNDKMSFNAVHDGVPTRIAYVVEMETGFHSEHNYSRKDKNYAILHSLVRNIDYRINGRIYYLW